MHPGTITSSLVTGVLGIQPQPTIGEVLGYVIYAVPMLALVLWPTRRRRPAVQPVTSGREVAT